MNEIDEALACMDFVTDLMGIVAGTYKTIVERPEDELKIKLASWEIITQTLDSFVKARKELENE